MLGLLRYFCFASASILLLHPYLASANWPVARYTNGTVGLINDGGEVHVQSAKLQVNGHLKVEGDLIVNGSNVALELTNLKPPKCLPPGGDKLQFDGTNWICVCAEGWIGETCENSESACNISSGTLSSKPSSLTHWFDFADTDEYGSTELAVMTHFTDKMGGASSMTVNYNVQYKLNVQNGLNAIYANEQYASLQFSSKSGSNPEVFVAYRIVNNVGGRSLPHCFIFGGRAGYAFGSQWSGDTEPSYDAITVTDAAGFALASLAAPFDGWHLADIYYGASDGFFKVDHGESESIAIAAKRPNPCGGCNGAYQDTELTNVAIGGFPWWSNIFCENYIGEVLIFNEKLSDSDRSMITSYLMTKWAIGNNAQQNCTMVPENITKTTSF